MAMSSKEWLCCLKSQKFGADTMFILFGPLPNVSHTRTRLSGLGNGSALRRVAFITLKIVVLAPIPRASVRTAMLVNAGFFPSILRPKRTSSTTSLSHFPPQASRVTSVTNPTFPNSWRAALSASASSTPRSARSRAAISRWLRTSSSSSFSRFRLPKSLFSQLIATLLLLQLLISVFRFLFVSEGHHRIDLHRSPRRYVARGQGHKQQQ